MDLRRFPGNATLPAGVAALTIDISIGPNDADQASSTFAQNHGLQVTRVFSGNVNVPQDSSTQSPAPWAVNITFQTPFPFIPPLGKGLVLDFQIQSFTPTNGTTPWSVDAAIAPTGTRVSNPSAQSNCKFSNGNYNNTISYVFPSLGGIWWVRYSNLLAGAPGLGVVGSQGVGGNWSGVPLPFSLAALGAPGCSWNASAAIILPLVADASAGAKWPDLQMPNDPGLAGQSFFDQAAFVDPTANALGLVTVWSSKWTFGTTPAPAATKVYALLNSNNSPTGTVQRQAVIARFNY
jgi:hypothetical protein